MSEQSCFRTRSRNEVIRSGKPTEVRRPCDYLRPGEYSSHILGSARREWPWLLACDTFFVHPMIGSSSRPQRPYFNIGGLADAEAVSYSVKSPDSRLDRCSRTLLEVDPDSRMIAAEALPFFQNLQGGSSNKHRTPTHHFTSTDSLMVQ